MHIKFILYLYRFIKKNQLKGPLVGRAREKKTKTPNNRFTGRLNTYL